MSKPKCNIKLSRVFLLLLFSIKLSCEKNLPTSFSTQTKVANDVTNDSKYDYSTLYEKPYNTPIIATFGDSSDFNDKRHTSHCTTVNNSTDIILTKRSRKMFPSFFTENNHLFINATRFPYDFLLIGFEQLEKNETNQIPTYITMFNGGKTTIVPIESLKPNQFYRFCCIEKGIYTVLPMDCVAIYMRYETKESIVWIYTKDRWFTILTVILYGVFGFVFGFILSVRLVKWYPMPVEA